MEAKKSQRKYAERYVLNTGKINVIEITILKVVKLYKMNTLQKIREIMGLPKTNLYAEVKIDDGRVLVTEADAFEPGVDVRVIDDSGSTVELDAGTYTLEDGRKVIVNGESRMDSFEVDEEEEIEVEVELETIPEAEEEGYRDGIDDEAEDVKEEMDYDKVRDVLAERFPDLDEAVRDAIAQVVSDIYSPEVEVEMEAETPKEDLSELLEEAFTSISKRLEALENVPAESGVNVSPTNLSSKHKKKDITQLSGVDRALHIIQNSHR
jgi:hypothetical protein